MSDNLAIWNTLGKTDPAHVKSFQRAGGFKGTAIKPIWMVKRLTELFGPVGQGWGMGHPRFETVHCQDGEVLVYCTVECWHTSSENTFYGVGGDKAVAKRNDGKMFTDDEAFKKAFTDAIGNAFKFLGSGADVHMGLFDDSKYVMAMHKEFADDGSKRKTGEKLTGPHTSITGLEKAIKEFATEMGVCATWEEWAALRDSKKFAGLLEQAERDHPDWWSGWKSQPDGFVPLKNRIAALEQSLAAEKAAMTTAG